MNDLNLNKTSLAFFPNTIGITGHAFQTCNAYISNDPKKKTLEDPDTVE